MHARVWLATGLFAVLALSGCVEDNSDKGLFGFFGPGDGPAGEPRMPADAPLAAFLHDLSEPVENQATIVEHIRTPVAGPLGESSIELDTWIIRPDVPEKVPVVLEITPYYGGGEPGSLGAVGRELIARGYAVGVSSVRGTGNSGGCFTQGGESEAKDSSAVIEHVANLPWANGNAGLIGVSYPGTTPQDVWVEAPPSLKAIVPISGISDLYKYNFVNGVHINPQGPAFNLYYWLLVGASPAGLSGGAQVLDAQHMATAAAGEACAEQVDVQQGGLTSGVDGNKDAYWQERDFLAELNADERDVERAAVFFVHGLQDWNVKTHMMEDWIEGLWASEVPMKMWLGQWAHAWPSPTGEDATCDYNTDTSRGANCRSDWWDQTLIAWFDQFLKETETGIMDAPAVQVQDDDGRWRHEARWPPVDVETQTYYFDGSKLTTEGPGSGFSTYPVLAVENTPEIPQGLTPLQPGLPSRLTFISEPFGQDATLSGMIQLEATVQASMNRANLIFSIGETQSGGLVRWFNHGALSLNHADDLANGRPSIADELIDITLNAFPQDDVIHAGNQLVISFGTNIAGGPGPSLAPANDPGEIGIDLASARLHLPIDLSLTYESSQPYHNWADVTTA